jgi:predicted small lipoprotein YifL
VWFVIRSFDRRMVRLAVIGAVAAVALAGCGRKGALDPPPSTSLSSNQPINQPPSLGEQTNPFGSATPSEPPPQAAPSAGAAAGTRPAEKKSFILDPLLK